MDTVVKTAQNVLYEQPTNEIIRVSLRLEHLFQKAMHSLHSPTPWDSRSTLSAIIDIMNLLDRPDLKAKLIKELSRHLDKMQGYAQSMSVDQNRLTAIIHELENIIDALQLAKGKFGEPLYRNEFLNTLKQYFQTPAGSASFNLPVFNHWLSLPLETRIEQLTQWLREFDTLRSAVSLLLRLVRQSSYPEPKIAPNGYYEIQFKPDQPCQLIRISVSGELGVYPEISIGRHRACLRFVMPSIENRGKQANREIPFELTCCAI